MPIAKANGISINYKIEGKGEPLVMIMGLNIDQSGWRFQVPSFKKHFQVVTFDNRGVGKSDKPPGPYTIRVMADDTKGLMDHLGIRKAHILGGSMGGAIAQEIAINYPERVSKLVLACTYACDDGGQSGQAPEFVSSVELYRQGRVSRMVSLIVYKRTYRLIFLPLMKVRRLFSGQAGISAFNAQYAACCSHNALDRLSLIKSPTLVIVGTGDRVLKPTSSDVIAAGIPGARVKKLEGGSHGCFLEMRNAFNSEVLEFLRSG